jgi:FkbM family methyltransferase
VQNYFKSLYLQIDSLLNAINGIDDIIKRAADKYSETLKLMDKGACIYLWGAKGIGPSFGKALLDAGFNNILFVDRNAKNIKGRIHGIEVVLPDEIIDPYNSVFIITSFPRMGEIYYDIRCRGYKNVLPFFVVDFFYSGISLFRYGVLGKDYYLGLGENLLSNKEKYLKLFTKFNDIKSKVTLAKQLLFRLTFDLDILIGLMEKEQLYFDKNIVSLVKEECFVDAGGFVGDTLDCFIRENMGNFKKYYLFEPDRDLIDLSRKKYDDDRIVLVNKGLYSENKVLSYNKTGDGTGSINGDGDIKIEVCRLDDEVKEKITFFKLDIEGAELEALKGGRIHIIEDKPTLAISLYHKPGDYIEISDYVLSLVPDYNIYLRSYVNSMDDTVLYAIYK